MRSRLLSGSCFLAVVALLFALRSVWSSATSDDGTVFTQSLHGVVRTAAAPASGAACNYLRGRGAVELCAPAEAGDIAYSMLCAAFPLLAVALALALACGTMTRFASRPPSAGAAATVGAALAAAVGGTTLAVIGMPRALATFAGLVVEFGGPGYNAAWVAVGLLAIATILAAASTIRG